jgi:hypothetical protein
VALAGPATTRCPRCRAAFGCAIATGSCWCAGLTLTPARQAQLAAEFDGCLCPGCLRELAEPTAAAGPPLH